MMTNENKAGKKSKEVLTEAHHSQTVEIPDKKQILKAEKNDIFQQ